MRFALRVTALLVSTLLFAGAVRAEINNCTEITSLPYFINTPGIYCLKGSLSFAGAGSAPASVKTRQ